MRLTAIAVCVALCGPVAGCFPMKIFELPPIQRTWDFSAEAVAGPRVRVQVIEAKITQKDAWVTLRVFNQMTTAARVEFATFVLSYPDGDTVEGYLSYGEKLGKTLAHAEQTLRREEQEEPLVAPGAHVDIQLDFHQYGRDLRRHETLTIDLAGVIIDGVSAQLPSLVLRAPPEAPIGEHI